jgi:hypothetical protein
MISSTAIRRNARALGSAAMLLFVAAVVVAPLCYAVSLCSMPCCHHTPSPNPSFAGKACPMKCTISKAPDDVTALAPQRSIQMAPATLPVTEVVVEVASAPSPPPVVVAVEPSRPLHLVNSVFLI